MPDQLGRQCRNRLQKWKRPPQRVSGGDLPESQLASVTVASLAALPDNGIRR
jgi:hypothetical protein